MSLPQASAVLQLLKPVTWFPPMWAFACGVVSSGQPLADHVWLIFSGIVLAGPMVCATSQAVNDWYDRHVDAINEPQRPIPSGRIPGYWGLYIAIIWTVLSLLWAWQLGAWGFKATLLALLLAWGYSAPPFRFKQDGWLGNAACGLSYEGLAWITGAAVVSGGALPNAQILTLALLYSLAAHGIMTLNDFKSIDGDKQMGVWSLPVQLGIKRAGGTACWVMLLPQFVVVALLLYWSDWSYALAVLLLIYAQIPLMTRFMKDPVKQALGLSALGVPLLVAGMMVSAFALRHASGSLA
ncbi:MAG: chlorophyll synthase ChlG [Betaproteobacteria bacterium]|jgi:chlorophyll synthase|nr:chlorophyll synthase ChlG [Betaproteobacteria bacterium]